MPASTCPCPARTLAAPDLAHPPRGWPLRALCLAAALAGWVALQAPAAAESLASSAASLASSVGSTSVRSLSESVHGSSRSSSPDGRQAVGDYRLIDLAALPDRPGFVELRLRREAASGAAEPADELRLHVPAAALAERPLAVGDRIVARARAYGLWFAQRATDGADRPFLLALHDDWQAELGSRAL